jgi:hypothetical protein
MSAVQHNIKYWGDEIAAEATRLVVETAAMHAVAAVEVGEIPAADDGWTIIRFEVHCALDRCPHEKQAALAQVIKLDTQNGKYERWDNRAQFYKANPSNAWQLVHSGSQGDEYGALTVSAGIAGNAATESASYGVGQIMGWHSTLLGYPDARAMAGVALSGGIPAQITQWGTYIERANDGAMLVALRALDWLTFATLYNGTGRPQDYADWLEAAYYEAVDALAHGVPPDHDLSTWKDRQTALASLGYDPGAIDGIYGPATKAALQAFQTDAGLIPDGIWGPLTESAMSDALDAQA